MAPKADIAFIGLGAMGFGMATNLVKKGYAVTGFDVWAPTLEKFAAAGGLTASTPAEAVKDKDYVVVMVATAAQAQAVLIDGPNPAVPALSRDAALILCSTVPSSYVHALADQLRTALGRPDVLLVDAPVSGGTFRAADGTLSIMAGGPDAALSRTRFLLEDMADPAKLYVVAGGVGAGSNMKMVHQVLAAVQILATSEAMGFASHLALDPGRTAEFVLASEGRSWMFENRTPRMLVEPAFLPVASAVTIILKDAGIITSEARRIGFPTLIASVAEQVYLAGLGRGFGPDDDSSLIRIYTEGLHPVAGGTALMTEEEKLAMVVNLLKGIHVCAAAETMAFAARLGLDLDQVFDLCRNAAGGSFMLETVGPEILGVFGGVSPEMSTVQGMESLPKLTEQLQNAVDEAQRLKVPLFLGSEALNVLRLALAHRPETAPDATLGQIVRVWGV